MSWRKTSIFYGQTPAVSDARVKPSPPVAERQLLPEFCVRIRLLHALYHVLSKLNEVKSCIVYSTSCFCCYALHHQLLALLLLLLLLQPGAQVPDLPLHASEGLALSL
jgi:hypothetical protein